MSFMEGRIVRAGGGTEIQRGTNRRSGNGGTTIGSGHVTERDCSGEGKDNRKGEGGFAGGKFVAVRDRGKGRKGKCL